MSATLLMLVFSTMVLINVMPLIDLKIRDTESAFLNRQLIQSDADTAIELTWTSRWTSYPQLVFNDSELVGDHVILNATFLGHAGFVEPYEMTMNLTEINMAISSPSSSVVYDTYPSRQNFTTSILVKVENGANETIISAFYNVSICNFLSPSLSPIVVQELETDYYSISWSSEDKNADDVHLYSLWISNDDGESYYLLAMNLTSGLYFWNSSGWLNTNYIVRVRAYSVDLSYFGGPFIDIPADYWPGDYADGYSSAFEHDGPFYTGIADVGVIPAGDLTYYWGSINNIIEWRLTCEQSDLFNRIPDSIPYSVSHNGKSYTNGTQLIGNDFENIYIIVQIDDLGLGVHNFTLEFVNPGDYGGIVSDTVQVSVRPNVELCMIVGVGVLLIASVALVLIEKKRRLINRFRDSSSSPSGLDSSALQYDILIE